MTLVLGIPLLIGSDALGGEPARVSDEQLKLGQELFTREWKPNDPRCHGGDGLGPVYNETSCIVCHSQGGAGGSGPAGMNVEHIVSLFGTMNYIEGSKGRGGSGIRCYVDEKLNYRIVVGGFIDYLLPGSRQNLGCRSVRLWLQETVEFKAPADPESVKYGDRFVISGNGVTLHDQTFRIDPDPEMGYLVITGSEGSFKAKSAIIRPEDAALKRVHPGLAAARDVVFHHFGVDPEYDRWRAEQRKQFDFNWKWLAGGSVIVSERNTPPLFGAALIDAVPDVVLVAAAERQPGTIRGRVSRTKDGRIGRFGWKAQTATLQEFILEACAGEMGLEVPGHHQASSPLAPGAKAIAPDLTQAECDALVAYVRSLPDPVVLSATRPAAVESGRKSFESIGCAECHVPKLGEIEGIYSDLLLHDMGSDVIVGKEYGGKRPVALAATYSQTDGSEWRTPPLWGFRDSAPYLHDGRADTLRQVMNSHKGQAMDSAVRYFKLSAQQQAEIEEFLSTLAAPPSPTPTVTPDAHGSPASRRSALGPSFNSPPAPRPTTLDRADAAARAKQERTAASRLNLAQSLERMDKPQGALVFYREIVRDEPGTAAARTAAERIKALGGAEDDRKSH